MLSLLFILFVVVQMSGYVKKKSKNSFLTYHNITSRGYSTMPNECVLLIVMMVEGM